MIQKCQFRNFHQDQHYAAALFGVYDSMQLNFKQTLIWYASLISTSWKIGEPGFPVAVAERGRQVLVKAGTTFQVADHDFTKFSITPSVCLVVDIPKF